MTAPPSRPRGAVAGVVVAALTLLATSVTGCDVSQEPGTAPPALPPSSASPQTRSPAPTPPPTLEVVGLGDSVMAGTNCGCQTIPARLAHALAARYRRPADATNLGVAGYTTQDVLNQLHRNAAARRVVGNADILVLIIGANDLGDALSTWRDGDCDRACYQPQVDAMRGRLIAILRLARTLRAGRPATVLVDNYWNVFTAGDVARAQGGEQQIDWSTEVTAAVNTAITEAARDTGERWVDLVQPFRHGGDDDPTPLLADDGDHPNKAGVDAIVAANLAAIPR